MVYNNHNDIENIRKDDIPMKKFLAVLLSAVLCGTVAYTVFAEEAGDNTVDAPAVLAEEGKSVEDVVADLANNEDAAAAAEKIVEAVRNGASVEDVKALIGKLGEYAQGAGVEDIKESGAIRDVLDKFLTDAGLNSEELNQAISESIIADAALNLYYKAPEAPTNPEAPSEEDVTDIPDTDDLF